MSKRIVLAVLSDMHGGCKYGLMNPEVTLYSEDAKGNLTPFIPNLTASQDFLWNHLYNPALRYTFNFANGDELHLIHNGDETHGDKYPVELVSTRMADQILIAIANLTPWYAYPNLRSMTIGNGTAAHNFGEGSSSILVSNYLKAAFPKVDTCTIIHALAEYNDLSTDYAHHGPYPGSRDWLRGNVARFYLRDLMYQEIQAGRIPPRLVLRAHYHTPVHEYLEMGGHVSELYVTPALCFLGEHAQQATRSAPRVTLGITLFEIVDGEIRKCHRLYRTLDTRTRKVY